MKAIQISAGILGFGIFVIGCVLSISPNEHEYTVAQTFVKSGAVLIVGLLINLAILGKKDTN